MVAALNDQDPGLCRQKTFRWKDRRTIVHYKFEPRTARAPLVHVPDSDEHGNAKPQVRHPGGSRHPTIVIEYRQLSAPGYPRPPMPSRKLIKITRAGRSP